ncbi:hypothetical protein OtV6_170c [Ostreococcus tauri virus RT-2011]|nr:hypothetical protein OtV6_170c [Ostreococcus tauri virus RT-2011]
MILIMKIALSGSYVTPFRKRRVKLSRTSVDKLKKVSRLSYINQWEYAGKIDNGKVSYVTSKCRSSVKSKEIEQIWYSEMGFHTHPGLGEDHKVITENTPIYTTLPSNSDFEAYIKGFPEMQCNIICDAHGYYVIDILKSVDHNTLPLPEAVNNYMLRLRRTPFMRINVFSDDGLEYFHTTLKNWKRHINSEVHRDMLHQFGISIRYYGYDDEPPVFTVYEV